MVRGNIHRRSTMNEIRLGIIGSGPIVHWVMDNTVKTPGIRICAVYSRSEEKGHDLAKTYDVRKVYTDMVAFLGDEEINFVYIASPNILHYPQAKAALLAGKNVILEKPFCTKASHAAELIRLAKERHLFLIDATPSVYMPNFALIPECLSKIGPVRSVSGSFIQYSSRYDAFLRGETPNVFNPEFGGGALMDLNYYNICLTEALFGKPNSAVYYPNLQRNGIDTSGVMVMAYDGFTAVCTAAKDSRGEITYRIHGEAGYIDIADGSSGLSRIRIVTKDGEEIVDSQPEEDRWIYEVQSIVRLVQAEDYESVYARLDRMLDVIATIETARKEAGILFPGDE